jgi:hypothetical protein
MQDFLLYVNIIYFFKKLATLAGFWVFIRIFASVFHRILDFTTRLGFYPAFIICGSRSRRDEAIPAIRSRVFFISTSSNFLRQISTSG